MSIPPETERTLDNLYDDFEGALDEKNWNLAKEIIQAFEDFSDGEAIRMKEELADAKRTHE